MIKRTIRALKLIWRHNKFAALVYCFNLPFKLLGMRFGFYYIRGHWYNFDDIGVATLIIYKEIIIGNYNAKLLQPHEKVIDVGAHVGMFSIPLARENPTVQFICLEPDPRNFENLQRNIQSSGVENITAYRIAVGPFGRIGVKHNFFNSGATNTYLGGDDVESRPLDHFGDCDLLKIDIEGAEYGIIRTKEDWGFAKSMIIEIHNHKDRDAMIESCKGAKILLTE